MLLSYDPKILNRVGGFNYVAGKRGGLSVPIHLFDRNWYCSFDRWFNVFSGLAINMQAVPHIPLV